MKSNKGFTLIELLAVIVILAIIALIAMPMVLNTINDAKKGAVQSSAYSVIQAVETKLTSDMMEKPNEKMPTSFSGTSADISVKGTQPISISLTLSNGAVTSGTIEFQDGVATIANGTVSTVSMKK